MADVNGDGNEDFYLGGSVGSGGKLLVANQRALFDQVPGTPMEKNKSCDEVAAVFFDAEGDGDQDLLVAGGGNEFPDQSAAYQTHLYLNQGAGQFTDAADKLPALRKSIGAVTVFDLDGDKDMDLFLGARLVPGKYGKLLGSHVLLNEGGKFKEVTSTVCPEMAGEFGNVSAAVAADFNKDGAMDLAIAGEWMSVKILINVN
ncbi:MAG TPA: VCBS repeat-containing protein, partial [Saprospiraceae bacterium]|nr:VCBS repeat-containing protein [Saprospiraceae bacterium]